MMKWMITVMAVLAAALAALHPGRADAGCKINVTATNSGHEKVLVEPDVKIRYGTWKDMKLDGWWFFSLRPGESFRSVYNATFGCNNKRRYRFSIESSNEDAKSVLYWASFAGLIDRAEYLRRQESVESHRYIYIPGAQSFTKSTDIDIGDLARFSSTGPDWASDPFYQQLIRARAESGQQQGGTRGGDAGSDGGSEAGSTAQSSGAQAGAAGSSAGAQGRPLCDLSGSWQQRNARTNDILPLVWKMALEKNEGGQDWRNYEVTRYKNGRRFVPKASGRLYQSPQEALLFYDTPSSVSQYNVSRIMSLRRLEVRPGCDSMKVVGGYTSQSGTVSMNGPLVFERIKPGSVRPPGSPVGRPTLNGGRSQWQKNWRLALPDNRREKIERRERLRGR